MLLQEQREGLLALLTLKSSFLHTLQLHRRTAHLSLVPRTTLRENHPNRRTHSSTRPFPCHTCSQTLRVPEAAGSGGPGTPHAPRAPTVKPFDSSFGGWRVFIRHCSIAFGLSRFLVQVNMDHGLSSPLVHLGIKQHD